MPPGITAINVGSQYFNKLRLMDLMNPFHLFPELVVHNDGVIVLALFALDCHLALNSKREIVIAPGGGVETPLYTKQGFRP